MLKPDKSQILLGNLKYGQTYYFNYTLKNEYDKDLMIRKVYVGCSACTKVKIEKDVLSPGEVAILSVCFTPGSIGTQTKSVTIESQTGNLSRPNLVLKFKSTVNE